MEFERKGAKTREERLRERRLSKLEKKEERLLEEKQPSFLSRKAAEMASPVIHKVKENSLQKQSKPHKSQQSFCKKPLKKVLILCWKKEAAGLGKYAEKRKNCGGMRYFRKNRFPAGNFPSWDVKLQQEHRQIWCSPRYRAA